MKIPLVYPKIPDTTGCMLKKCIVFEKLDGTNIHFTIRKGKWTSYGTRRDDFNTLINNGSEGEAEFIKAHPELDGVLKCQPHDLIIIDEIIHASEKLSKVEELILFMEYFGYSSFAGQHKRDEEHTLTLFDAQIDGRMMLPEEFLKDFRVEEFPEYFPQIIYKGKYSGQLVEDIRNGKYPVIEGAVIKGEIDGQVYMAKVKTNTYMEKLKEQFKDKWQDYWE
jgi:hypothetical protein